jgi:hypothetical protein
MPMFGSIESEDDIFALLQRHRQVIIPNDDDLTVASWWLIRDDCVESLYPGTPETFINLPFPLGDKLSHNRP